MVFQVVLNSVSRFESTAALMAFGESFTEENLAFLVIMSFKVNAIGIK